MMLKLDSEIIKELIKHLEEIFKINSIEQVELLEDGFMCQNFKIKNNSKIFFLKQYRHYLSQRITEIQKSETFFYKHGFPVILPIIDRYGRNSFWFQGCWYSLYPYIEGQLPQVEKISKITIKSLASNSAKMHLVGLKTNFIQGFRQLKFWEFDTFKLETIELKNSLKNKKSLNSTEQKILNNLKYKERIIKKNNFQSNNFHLTNDTLLHGDFIYQNTFIDEYGEISHIFDFEKTYFGPRAYDLARNILINCFDDGWTEKNYQQAKIFLSTYQLIYPIKKEEFLFGLKLYINHIIHSTWMEAKYLLFKSENYLPVYYSNIKRIKKLFNHEEEFIEKIFN